MQACIDYCDGLRPTKGHRPCLDDHGWWFVWCVSISAAPDAQCLLSILISKQEITDIPLLIDT
ncbi:hypothetical protein [uncultured Nostoc sp.]|uniref:hypothetical protein n=1 Tax=uncultured Nostoc sp. TaxID=340711 RepID=UPI0035CB4932